MVADHYDLVVAGAGSAGLAAAGFARRLGARVALVEAHRVGGDCTWTGCVPSKALLHAAGVAHAMRHADAVGLPAHDVTADLGAVMARVRQAIGRVYALETSEELRRQGIEVVLGPSRFRGPHTLEVAGRTLQGRHFVICTGARAVVPPIPGLAAVEPLTYENVWGLRTLPARLLVMGGGPVGVEMAQAFRRLGSAVTLVGRNHRLLPQGDPEAGAALAAVFADEGIEVRMGTAVTGVERMDSGLRGRLASQSAAERQVEADAVLVAAGRRPNVEGLELERAGVAVTERGIVVDGQLRTSQRHIYAAGDVTGGFQFTHYAGWQGVLAVRNALLPGSSWARRATVPWVVFTQPEVAQAGLAAAEARQDGQSVVVHRWPIERIDRAQTAGERSGFLKLVSRPDGRLIGATVVAGAAGEIINELTLAIHRRLRLQDLAASIHVYPSYGFSIQQAAAEATVESLARGWRGQLLRALARLWP